MKNKTKTIEDMSYGIRHAPGTCCPEMDVVVCRGCGHDHGRQYLIDRDKQAYLAGAKAAIEATRLVEKEKCTIHPFVCACYLEHNKLVTDQSQKADEFLKNL